MCQKQDMIMRHAAEEGSGNFDDLVSFNMHALASHRTRASSISHPSKCGHRGRGVAQAKGNYDGHHCRTVRRNCLNTDVCAHCSEQNH